MSNNAVNLFIFVLTLFLSSKIFSANQSQQNPDFTKGEQLPNKPQRDWHLGPTGMRGWMHGDGMETSSARQILVTKVEPKSPAAEIVQVNDVILGFGGKNFSYDTRIELSKAVAAAEATDGKLKLTIWRNSQILSLEIQLPVLGSYSDTAPFNCQKSAKIFERGCEAIYKKVTAPNFRGNNPIVDSANMLALLTSGKNEYLPLIKKEIARLTDNQINEKGLPTSWYYGPVISLIAEYTLATNDKSFMQQMEILTMRAIDGQNPIGTWGHNFIDKTGKEIGYGMMNSPGIPLIISMALARKAGLQNKKLDDIIKKNADFLKFYVGKGSVPYGDHTPWIENHDDNGKNGMAAILFNLIDDKTAAEYFTHMSLACHGTERETGHTGNFFNIYYALPSVALAGPVASGAWMKEFSWYYDYCRQWDGTFSHQGPPGDAHESCHKWDTTGIMLLSLAQGRKTSYFTGKKPTIIKELTLDEAKRIIDDGRGWNPKFKEFGYKAYNENKLLTLLSHWSPVVRERAAMELSRRKGDFTAKLKEMLMGNHLYSQLGATQTICHLRGRAASLIPEITKNLDSTDLWLVAKSAEALANIGKDAKPVIPKLLQMLASKKMPNDPREMLQRYLSYSMFGNGGLLQNSIEGIDKNELFNAVIAVLKNEDGAARSSASKIYDKLTLDEIKPLLPFIIEAIIHRAPSNLMFADGVQNEGLKILAKHKIKQGLPLAVDYIKTMKAHASENRIKEILAIIETYGTHAKEFIPELEKHIKYFEFEEPDFPKRLSIQKANDVRKTIEKIKTFTNTPTLIEVN